MNFAQLTISDKNKLWIMDIDETLCWTADVSLIF